MWNFFDKITYRVFLFSQTIQRNILGKGDNEDDAKIQTLFIISLFQCFSVFFIFLDFFLFRVFDTYTPKYIVLLGVVIIGIVNYLRYFKGDRLAEMTYKESLFFNNVVLTHVITILYFIITIFLFKIVGDSISSAKLN